MKKSKFLEKAREKHGYKYQYPDLPEVVMQNDYINVLYNGVIYRQKVLKHFKGNRPELKTVNKTTEEFIKESISIWGDKYDYSMLEYKNARTKVKIIYDGIIYEQYPNSHLNAYPVEGYLDQNVFIQKAIKKWGDKYDYSLVKFENANTKVEILFNGDSYYQTPHNHLKYAPEKRLFKKTTDQFIQESIKIHGDFRYLYDKVIYNNDREKVVIICPIHGDFTQRPNQHLRGAGCPNCNESRGEKEISKFLDKYDINYYRQYRFNDCRGVKYPLPFDFYIPSTRTCIEFDGEQHFLPLSFFGGQEALEKLKINDKIKNNYCEDNYINLIRIRYDQIDDIYRILYENLKNYIKTKKTS
jgi:hypothetical protein